MHARSDEFCLIPKRNSLACSFSNGDKHRSLNFRKSPSEDRLESLQEEFSRVSSFASGMVSDGSEGGTPIIALVHEPTNRVSYHTLGACTIAETHPKEGSVDSVVSRDSLDLGSRSFEGCLGEFENEVRFDQCPR
jgi:hypothetical protein